MQFIFIEIVKNMASWNKSERNPFTLYGNESWLTMDTYVGTLVIHLSSIFHIMPLYFPILYAILNSDLQNTLRLKMGDGMYFEDEN